MLDSLPERELRAGFGELAKYHFIGGRLGAAELIGNARAYLEMFNDASVVRRYADHRSLLRRQFRGDDLRSRLLDGCEFGELARDELIAACVAIKAEVVSSDETEGGRRALLNYGHTLAHALEIAGRFDLRHGEAVAIGLRYASLVAQLMDRIDTYRAADHESVLDSYGLDTALPPGVDHDEIIELFGRDKKATDGITFVLDGPNGLEVVPNVDPSVLRSALERM